MTTENLISKKINKKGLTLEQLSRETGLSKFKINKALKSLLDKGLIKKEPQFNSSYKYKLIK